MSELLLPFRIDVPASDLEPPQLFELLRALGESTNAALRRPYVDLRATAATSIAHNQAAFVKVNLADEEHVDADYFGVGASVVTILEDGYYDISAGSGFASGTAFSEFAISWNGLAFNNKLRRFKPGIATSSAEREGSLFEPEHFLVEGDTIQIGAYQSQTSGTAALNTIATSRLVVRKVG